MSFTDGRFDETAFQTTAVNALKTDHSQVRCSDKDIGADFPKIVWHSEVPLLRTAPAPLFRLSRLVRENNFKVVLTGEGADEMFAGYNIFKEDKVRRFWARNPESKIRPQLLAKLYPYIFSHGGGKNVRILESFFKRGMTETGSPVYSHMMRWNNTTQLQNFFRTGSTMATGFRILSSVTPPGCRKVSCPGCLSRGHNTPRYGFFSRTTCSLPKGTAWPWPTLWKVVTLSSTTG